MIQWISVDDRLPEIDEETGKSLDVLVVCISHGETTEFGHLNTYPYGHKYLAMDTMVKWPDMEIPSFRSQRFYGRVTHWMPLPEMPE